MEVTDLGQGSENSVFVLLQKIGLRLLPPPFSVNNEGWQHKYFSVFTDESHIRKRNT